MKKLTRICLVSLLLVSFLLAGCDPSVSGIPMNQTSASPAQAQADAVSRAPASSSPLPDRTATPTPSAKTTPTTQPEAQTTAPMGQAGQLATPSATHTADPKLAEQFEGLPFSDPFFETLEPGGQAKLFGSSFSLLKEGDYYIATDNIFEGGTTSVGYDADLERVQFVSHMLLEEDGLTAEQSLDLYEALYAELEQNLGEPAFTTGLDRQMALERWEAGDFYGPSCSFYFADVSVNCYLTCNDYNYEGYKLTFYYQNEAPVYDAGKAELDTETVEGLPFSDPLYESFHTMTRDDLSEEGYVLDYADCYVKTTDFLLTGMETSVSLAEGKKGLVSVRHSVSDSGASPEKILQLFDRLWGALEEKLPDHTEYILGSRTKYVPGERFDLETARDAVENNQEYDFEATYQTDEGLYVVCSLSVYLMSGKPGVYFYYEYIDQDVPWLQIDLPEAPTVTKETEKLLPFVDPFYGTMAELTEAGMKKLGLEPAENTEGLASDGTMFNGENKLLGRKFDVTIFYDADGQRAEGVYQDVYMEQAKMTPAQMADLYEAVCAELEKALGPPAEDGNSLVEPYDRKAFISALKANGKEEFLAFSRWEFADVTVECGATVFGLDSLADMAGVSLKYYAY